MGLNPGEREVIELQLRQGLETAEVATVLGVSRNHAHALLARARDQLETCLAVLLVGRAGRGECDELGALLAGWDGRLTVLLRKRVHRHIERCPACDASRARELRPAMLLGLSPGAALAAGATMSLRLAAGAPEGLRAHTITLATGQGVGAVAHRAAVLGRAGAFNRSGFPRPVHGGGGAGGRGAGGRGAGGRGARGRGAGGARRSLRSSPQRAAVVTAAIVIAAIIVAVAFALTGNGRAVSPAADPSPPGVAAAAATSAAASTPASASAAAAAGASKRSASSAASTARPSTAAATDPARATPTPSTAGSSADPPSATPTTAGPTAAASATAAGPAPGALSENPAGGTIELRPGGAPRQIDLTGSGRGDWRVAWSLTVANDPFNIIGVSPVSGRLTSADSTAVVTVRANWIVPCGSRRPPTITVSPGGAVFTVCTGATRPFTGHRDVASAAADAVDGSAPGSLPQRALGGHRGRVR